MLRYIERISGVLFTLSLLCYLASFFLWDFLPEKSVDEIYILTLFNLLMVAGLVVMVLSKTDLLHFVGTGMFCVFSWLIMLKIFGDVYYWTDYNIGTFFIDGLLSIFLAIKIKKIKDNG